MLHALAWLAVEFTSRSTLVRSANPSGSLYTAVNVCIDPMPAWGVTDIVVGGWFATVAVKRPPAACARFPAPSREFTR